MISIEFPIERAYVAEVRSVYDGDTVRLDVDLGFGIWRRNVPCRLYGINAPELRGESLAAGRAARDRLRQMLHYDEPDPEPVTIIVRDGEETGKFGRWLIELRTEEGLNVNRALVDEGHAVEAFY